MMSNREEVDEHCHDYYWGSSSSNDKTIVQMSWTMYQRVVGKSQDWVATTDAIQSCVLCNMDTTVNRT